MPQKERVEEIPILTKLTKKRRMILEKAICISLIFQLSRNAKRYSALFLISLILKEADRSPNTPDFI